MNPKLQELLIRGGITAAIAFVGFIAANLSGLVDPATGAFVGTILAQVVHFLQVLGDKHNPAPVVGTTPPVGAVGG